MNFSKVISTFTTIYLFQPTLEPTPVPPSPPPPLITANKPNKLPSNQYHMYKNRGTFMTSLEPSPLVTPSPIPSYLMPKVSKIQSMRNMPDRISIKRPSTAGKCTIFTEI